MATIVFLHGLNTYGDDLLHIGPLTFGPMHTKLARAFRERDIDFVPIAWTSRQHQDHPQDQAPATVLGTGSPEEQAERARRFLDETGLGDVDSKFHLFGQSTGGLVARALAARPELRHRILSVITIGTPHEGTEAARFGLEFNRRYPKLARLFSTFGYDSRAKASIFRHYTPEAMHEFNLRYPPHSESRSVPHSVPRSDGMREISLVCQISKEDVSWPLSLLHRHLHPRPANDNSPVPSDGFILCHSQSRGETRGPFALDHFDQLGFHFHHRSSVRRKAEQEFVKMIDTVSDIISTHDDKTNDQTHDESNP